MPLRSADRWTCADADEALVCRVWQGDEDALDTLLSRYRSLVRTKARSYFLVGADREDVVQEGMIGLYKAIRDFDAARQTTFRGFADLCVTRQIISAIKSATRQKHSPLNGYVSLHLPAYHDDEPEQELVDHVVSADLDPAEERAAIEWIDRESRKQLDDSIALTRARNRCYLVWGNFRNAGTSAPAWLLHPTATNSAEGMEQMSARFKSLDDATMRKHLEELVAASTVTDASPATEPTMRSRYGATRGRSPTTVRSALPTRQPAAAARASAPARNTWLSASA